MKALIWKELWENIKWVPLPGLVILLVFFINKPDEPMPDVTVTFFFALTAVAFAAALGFVQIFFDAHGDKRSLLLHRPLSPSRIFLAKALTGVGLYLLGLGIPFVCLESWYATPGKMPAPYDWRMSLPWLADILSGLAYYFVGVLVAQRDVRWYGSRVLPLAAAFFCSYLVWTLPEFWQALAAIGIIGSFVGKAAWGSFTTGGEYAPQTRLAKAALAMTFLAGLLIISVLGKQMLGGWFDSGVEYHYDLDRQGRLLYEGFKPGVGQVGRVTYLDAQEAPDLEGQPTDDAPNAFMETPPFGSYRNSGRFYVQVRNDSKPSQEIWYYDQGRHRLFGYDTILHHSLGSFGPDGFVPAGQEPGGSFQGEFRYRSDRWRAIPREYLALPGSVYAVDFARREIRTLFTAAAGETVTYADGWEDHLDERRTGVVIGTDRSFHFLTQEGVALFSVPRAYDHQKHGYVYAGPLENPERYFVWYQTWQMFLAPDEFKTTPGFLLEYDAAGSELARRTVPPVSFPAASHAEALFGLITPMTEAATLVEATRYLRSEARLRGGIRKPAVLKSLEDSSAYIPGAARYKVTPRGLIPGYVALILVSATASALCCFLLARRHAFSRARLIVWTLSGFILGWVGLVLMLALQEWPARIACTNCRKLRVVARNRCEHCGAQHAVPEPDGTEIFEPMAVTRHVTLATR